MPFPRRLYIAPILLGIIIVQLNLQWMRIYQTINAPTADSLVYLTQAYKDYWTFRSEGIVPLLKNCVAGNQQTSPLLWWLSDISFLFFGLEPSNAYLVIGLAYLAWVAGVMYLAWQCKQDRQFVLICGLLAVFLPSAVRPGFGLRSFLIDFPVSAPFIWSTAFLLKSDLFRNRKFTIFYGSMAGVTILLRTITFPYFLAHVVILVFIGLQKKIWPHLGNMLLGAFITLLVTGWFLLPNFSRILSYYFYWSKEAQKFQETSSFTSNLLHYLALVAHFHFSIWVFAVYACFFSAALFLFFRKICLQKKSLTGSIAPLIILLSMVTVPTLVLSLYASRTVNVDYPFLAGYWMLPVWMWMEFTPQRKIFRYPLYILLACFMIQHSQYLFRSPIQGSGVGDFKERQVLRMILEDAEKKGLPSIEVGNLGIHQHNCLSYQYWVLANYFPEWRDRFTTARIGRAETARQLAEMNRKSDYVISILDNPEKSHPNNRFAPQARQILQEWGLQTLGPALALPDGSSVEILVQSQKVHIITPVPLADGWYEDPISLQILNPARREITLHLQLDLFPLQDKPQPAAVHIQSEKEGLFDKTLMTGFRVSEKLVFPPILFEKDTRLTLRISSSWAHVPNSISPEKRRLAFRNLSITEN